MLTYQINEGIQKDLLFGKFKRKQENMKFFETSYYRANPAFVLS